MITYKKNKQKIKLILLLVCCFVQTVAIAQNAKKQLFSFTVDNDFFLLNYTDAYYTNGFFFQLSNASIKKNKKQITRYELGQTMYTTRERRLVWGGFENLDRQYCGYLYGRVAKDFFLKKDAVFTLRGEVGVTGDASLSRQLQEWYHNVLGLFDYPYWDTQIPNSIGANMGAKYVAPLFYKEQKNQQFRLITTSEMNLGSYFNNLKVGNYFCIGSFETVENTALFNNQISANRSSNRAKKEWVFYFYPQIIYQAYNGTIQGNILKKQPESYLAHIQPWVYQHSFGVLYAHNNWAAKMEAVFQTKEASSQLQNHKYISLQAAYSF